MELPTHWLHLAEDGDDENRLEDEEYEEEDERHQEVERVERMLLIWSGIVLHHRSVPVPGPPVSSVQCNVAGADEEDGGRHGDEKHRQRGAIIYELVSDRAIEHEHPCGGYYEAYVATCKTLHDVSNFVKRDGRNQTYYAHCLGKRKAANSKDLTYLNQDIAQQKKLYLSMRKLALAGGSVKSAAYLRPTAAFLTSDRHNKNSVTKIAMPHRSITPF